MAEVFHHGSVHREQIYAVLTGLGVEVPDIQPWGYADATGRQQVRRRPNELTIDTPQ